MSLHDEDELILSSSDDDDQELVFDNPPAHHHRPPSPHPTLIQGDAHLFSTDFLGGLGFADAVDGDGDDDDDDVSSLDDGEVQRMLAEVRVAAAEKSEELQQKNPPPPQSQHNRATADPFFSIESSANTDRKKRQEHCNEQDRLRAKHEQELQSKSRPPPPLKPLEAPQQQQQQQQQQHTSSSSYMIKKQRGGGGGGGDKKVSFRGELHASGASSHHKRTNSNNSDDSSSRESSQLLTASAIIDGDASKKKKSSRTASSTTSPPSSSFVARYAPVWLIQFYLQLSSLIFNFTCAVVNRMRASVLGSRFLPLLDDATLSIASAISFVLTVVLTLIIGSITLRHRDDSHNLDKIESQISNFKKLASLYRQQMMPPAHVSLGAELEPSSATQLTLKKTRLDSTTFDQFLPDDHFLAPSSSSSSSSFSSKSTSPWAALADLSDVVPSHSVLTTQLQPQQGDAADFFVLVDQRAKQSSSSAHSSSSLLLEHEGLEGGTVDDASVPKLAKFYHELLQEPSTTSFSFRIRNHMTAEEASQEDVRVFQGGVDEILKQQAHPVLAPAAERGYRAFAAREHMMGQQQQQERPEENQVPDKIYHHHRHVLNQKQQQHQRPDDDERKSWSDELYLCSVCVQVRVNENGEYELVRQKQQQKSSISNNKKKEASSSSSSSAPPPPPAPPQSCHYPFTHQTYCELSFTDKDYSAERNEIVQRQREKQEQDLAEKIDRHRLHQINVGNDNWNYQQQQQQQQQQPASGFVHRINALKRRQPRLVSQQPPVVFEVRLQSDPLIQLEQLAGGDPREFRERLATLSRKYSRSLSTLGQKLLWSLSLAALATTCCFCLAELWARRLQRRRAVEFAQKKRAAAAAGLKSTSSSSSSSSSHFPRPMTASTNVHLD